jgi:hypothetical protein
MKYIITESKFENLVIEYLDKMFDVTDINWTNPYDIIDDETGEEGDDESRILFYIGDYNGGDDRCFMWYGCEYYDKGSKARELCPIVQLEHPYDIQLNGYFDDKWHEPFKKWFTKNFNLPVKTIE